MQNTPRNTRYNRRQAARDTMAPNDDNQSLYNRLAKVAEGNIQQNQQIQALTENMNKMAQSVSNSRIEKRLTLQNCPKMKTGENLDTWIEEVKLSFRFEWLPLDPPLAPPLPPPSFPHHRPLCRLPKRFLLDNVPHGRLSCRVLS